MLSQLINRDCTIIRRLESSTTDAHGNEVPEEDLVTTVCEVQQQQRQEQGLAGELSDTRWLGFFLPGVELRTGDAVDVDGLGTFELVGDPWPARNPRTQQESHVEATLRRTEGTEDS